MKKIITILTSCLLVSCTSVPKNVSKDKFVRTEIESMRNGAVTTKTTYRFDKKIMTEMKGSLNTRVLFLNGKIMYIESDDDNDGFFESIMITGEGWPPPYFELFIRDRNGTIRPMPTDQYEEKYNKIAEGQEKFRKVFKKVLLEEKAKLKKEGKPITGWLKKQLEAIEKE